MNNFEAEITDSSISSVFDKSIPPVLTIKDGAVVKFNTLDPRRRALFSRTPGQGFELPAPDHSLTNPVSGPIFLEDAAVGDSVVIELLDIDLESQGWTGTHANKTHVSEGLTPSAFGIIAEVQKTIKFADNIPEIQLRPMVGCLGVAPESDPIGTQFAGKHYGNMDHTALKVGASAVVPVQVEGALISLGDVHAAQGDGELSGIALEIPAIVKTKIRLVKNFSPKLPLIVNETHHMLCAAGENFEEASRMVLEYASELIKDKYDLDPNGALALLSVTSDLRIGGYYGGPQVSVRLEIPKYLELLDV